MLDKYSEGCYRLRGRSVTSSDLLKLQIEAKDAPLRRARICVHRDANDPIQEMFVFMLKDSPKGTYKYAKSASFLLMDGEMDIEFYSEGGKLMSNETLNTACPFIKIEAGTHIRPIIRSDSVLLYETHAGPWTGPTERVQKDRSAMIAFEREHALNG